MNEEEKKAIEVFKYWVDGKGNLGIGNLEAQTLLNLIEKQQKEIEKLKSKKYILNVETNEIKEIPISENYISKDKIRELLRDVQDCETDFIYDVNVFKNVVLNSIKELLGE